jgi:glyoxylase-like metal-dependent hydrolase (beta-lactamase superfamily II)
MSHSQTHTNSSLSLGAVEIHRVVEQVGAFFPRKAFFPGLTDDIYAANQHWLEPLHFEAGTGNVMLTIQSWIVKTAHHTILVDTCCGNDKHRPNRPQWHMQKLDTYMKNLKAVGLTPDDIDFVMCTHLHGDHVGWNTKLDNGRWVPTFPKARYLMSAVELDHWTKTHAAKPKACAWIGDSVLPVVEAGRAERVRSDHAFSDLVKLVPTPGHTVDHFAVHVGTAGHDAFLTGDMVHSPIQCRHPDIGMFSDHDSKLSSATRHAIFSRFADTPTVMCMAHFAAPCMGHIKRAGSAYEYVPLA